MRSLFLDKSIYDLSVIENEVIISDKDKLHHLNNVLRIKVGVDILLFNSNGQYCLSNLSEISKRNASLEIKERGVYQKPHEVELAICWLKKDALEDAVNNAIQLGISKIHFVKSEYAQNPSDLTKSRFQKLLISAMEQSNHFLMPDIYEYPSIEDFIERNQDIRKYGFTLKGEFTESEQSIEKKCLYFIGPEGGFSEKEISELRAKNMKFFHLPMPIMRAPVAVSCAMGYIVAQIN